MSIPGTTETFSDFALGAGGLPADDARIFVGACSTGTANTVYGPYTSGAAVQAAHGYGPCVDRAALSSDLAGGDVYVMPTTNATAGAAGSVTAVGTGTSVATVAGAAYDTLDVIFKITAAGASLGAATAAFIYSLDGGDSWSEQIAMPVSGVYAIATTNITITFGAGSFVVDDTYSFATTAPLYSTTNLTSALVALKAAPEAALLSWAVIVGTSASSSASATMAAIVATQADAFEVAHRFMLFRMECGPDTDATTAASFAAFVNERVEVTGGFAEITSSLTGRIQKRNVGWITEVRDAQIPPQEHPGRVRRGPLPASVVSLYRDEAATPALDVARFTTLRTIDGRTGFYVCRGKTMAALGSDYASTQNRRVMDKLARRGRYWALEFLNETIRVEPLLINGVANTRAGYILEAQAQSIENSIEQHLNDELFRTGNVDQPVTVRVKRDENIISTNNLTITFRGVPFGYGEGLALDFGFENPAIAIAA